MNNRSRPRRNRINDIVRSMHRETAINVGNLVCPLFVADTTELIASMPGVFRLSPQDLDREVQECVDLNIKSFILFPVVPEALKTSDGAESHNPEGIIPVTLTRLRKKFGDDIVLFTDIALDPYSSDGHDGIVKDGEILNDETIDVLCKQALMQARHGTNVVSPSDMMDGRVARIREYLDQHSFTNVSIMSYSIKYASAFYGPFRDALDSQPKAGDKKTYQMDPANKREAMRELRLDEQEGADIIMIKPITCYLDVAHMVREQTALPIAGYHVSGSYAMIKAAADNGWIDEKAVVMESLLSMRRAGVDIILTYYAKQVGQWIKSE